MFNSYGNNFGSGYGMYQVPNYSVPQYAPQPQISYQQPQQTQPQQVQAQPQPQYMQKPNSNVEYVNGIEGAKALAIPPNHTRLLVDSDSHTFFIKTTDSEGKPTIRIFDYEERTGEKKDSANFVTLEQFEDFKREMFDRLKGKQNVNKENRNERK